MNIHMQKQTNKQKSGPLLHTTHNYQLQMDPRLEAKTKAKTLKL